MKNSVTLITFASWETRFLARFAENLRERPVTKARVYYLDEFADWSQSNRDSAHAVAQEKGVEFSQVKLSVGEPADNWRILREDMPKQIAKGANVLVDLTTMPREFIWTIFWFLDLLGAKTEFVYSRPQEYNKDWLSRDPQRPRLVYKMSGIADPGKRVCLVALAGYDVERTHQLINFYEPATTFLGLQEGDADTMNDAKMAENRRRFHREPDRCCFMVNAYSLDQGECDIVRQTGAYFDSHNVVMSSLGPKLSAVALYRIQRRYPQVALAYAPSREFNREYSVGVGPSYWGNLG